MIENKEISIVEQTLEEFLKEETEEEKGFCERIEKIFGKLEDLEG